MASDGNNHILGHLLSTTRSLKERIENIDTKRTSSYGNEAEKPKVKGQSINSTNLDRIKVSVTFRSPLNFDDSNTDDSSTKAISFFRP